MAEMKMPSSRKRLELSIPGCRCFCISSRQDISRVFFVRQTAVHGVLKIRRFESIWRPGVDKLITTSPLEHYEIATFGLRMPPMAFVTRQSHYD